MLPLTRYTSHVNARNGEWYVFDNLRDVVTHQGLTAWGATDVARVQEETWRKRCARQQEAEHRATTP